MTLAVAAAVGEELVRSLPLSLNFRLLASPPGEASRWGLRTGLLGPEEHVGRYVSEMGCLANRTRRHLEDKSSIIVTSGISKPRRGITCSIFVSLAARTVFLSAGIFSWPLFFSSLAQLVLPVYLISELRGWWISARATFAKTNRGLSRAYIWAENGCLDRSKYVSLHASYPPLQCKPTNKIHVVNKSSLIPYNTWKCLHKNSCLIGTVIYGKVD